jgi:hypothetical protein
MGNTFAAKGFSALSIVHSEDMGDTLATKRFSALEES